MPATTLRFTREIDLPPTIVWDALVDPELVAGWLAEAEIDARVGGRYDLRWLGSSELGDTVGEITELANAGTLSIETSNIGVIEFRLTPLEGGTRGDATRVDVRVEVDTDPRFAAFVSAHWHTNLEQLEQLLRGHPVDWANWERDRGPVWQQYFEGALHSRAR